MSGLIYCSNIDKISVNQSTNPVSQKVRDKSVTVQFQPGRKKGHRLKRHYIVLVCWIISFLLTGLKLFTFILQLCNVSTQKTGCKTCEQTLFKEGTTHVQEVKWQVWRRRFPASEASWVIHQANDRIPNILPPTERLLTPPPASRSNNTQLKSSNGDVLTSPGSCFCTSMAARLLS